MDGDCNLLDTRRWIVLLSGLLFLICFVIDVAIAEGVSGGGIVQAQLGSVAPFEHILVEHFPQYVNKGVSCLNVGEGFPANNLTFRRDGHQAIWNQRHNVMLNGVKHLGVKDLNVCIRDSPICESDTKQSLRFDRWSSSGIGQNHLHSNGLPRHELNYIGGSRSYPRSLFKAEAPFCLFGGFFTHTQSFGTDSKRVLANDERFIADDIGPFASGKSLVGRFKLPVGDKSQSQGGEGQDSIEYNIQRSQSFKTRTVGILLIVLGYFSSCLAFFCWYWGMIWRGVFVFILAGVLAHSALSLLLFGHWWPFTHGFNLFMA